MDRQGKVFTSEQRNQGAGGSAQRGAREGAAVRGRGQRAGEGLWGACRKKAFGQVLTQKLVQGLSVARACRHMCHSRQAYYKSKHRERERQQQACRVVSMVIALRVRQPRSGTRKLHHILGQPLREAGIKAGRDALFDILHSARLLVRPRRAYHKTTDSHHHFRRHPNLLKAGEGQVVPAGPEQVWVAGITYLLTSQLCTYLSLVTDAYSRNIVGYHVAENALTQRNPAHVIIEEMTKSTKMEEDIKRWTAKRKSVLVLDIIQGKTTVAEASRQYKLSR